MINGYLYFQKTLFLLKVVLDIFKDLIVDLKIFVIAVDGIYFLVYTGTDRFVCLFKGYYLCLQLFQLHLLMLQLLPQSELINSYMRFYSCVLSITSYLLNSWVSFNYSSFILDYIFLYSATNPLKKWKQFELQCYCTSANWSLINSKFLRDPKRAEVLRLSPRSYS